MNKKILVVLSLVFFSLQAFSAPYQGEIFKFTQPDGSIVEAKIFGDEYYSRCEGLDGYTLIRDEQTGWLCYAELSKDGNEFVSTGIHYTVTQENIFSLKSSLGIEKGLDIKSKSIEQIIASNREILDSDASNLKSSSLKATTLGNFIGITILVDFSDQPAPTSDISIYEEMLNGDNFTTHGNNGSVKQYYSDISDGKVTYTNEVFGFFRAPKTFAEYDAMGYAVGAKQILKAALEWVDEQGFDFSTLTTNSNNRILAINLMYTGYPKAWSKGMWWHKSNYWDFSADGVKSMVYNCSPANFDLRIGTICHENGHMLCGWPDTYQYSGREEGIGGWDLMCSSGGKNPPPPNPYFRNWGGWDTQTEINSSDTELTSEANDFNIYKYVNPNDSKEFFLIENRLKEGRSGGIPGEGLTIWHIDRNKSHQANSLETQVVLIENAYGEWSNSTHYMAPFSGTYVDEFSAKTYPSSNWHSGEESGFRVYDISPIGQQVSFKVSFEESDMINKASMNIIDANSESVSYPIERIIDKKAYYSFMGTASPTTPLEVTIDLGAVYDLTKFKYLARRASGGDAIKNYQIFVSNSSDVWGDAVASGTWVQDKTLKTAEFNATGRYIKLIGLSNESASQKINAAEIYIHGTISSSSKPNKAIDISPEDNSGLIETNGILEWESGDGAASHKVYLSNDATIDESDLVSTQSGTTYSYAGLQNAHTYYWRIDEVNENGITTGDVWMFSTIAEVISTGKPIKSSSDLNSSYGASKANDGNIIDDASRWLSATGQEYPFWLEINLEDIYAINGIRLYTGWDGYNKPINDFQLQYWKNGAWVDALTVTDNSDPAKYWGFETVNATKVRLNITKSSEDRTRVFEFEVYGKYISDCNGDIGGNAYIDECDICVEGDTGLKDCSTPTDIGKIDNEKIDIYPNPVEDILFVVGLNRFENIEIIDLIGNKQSYIISGNSIDVSHLRKGLYFIKINDQTLRFIKK